MKIRNWHLAGLHVLVKLLTTDKSWEIDNGEVDLIGTLCCDVQDSLTQGLTFELRSKNLATCLCSTSTSVILSVIEEQDIQSQADWQTRS